jgi:hypothetical protein
MDGIRVSPAWAVRVSGVIAGALAGLAAVVVTGTAVAHRIAEPAAAPFIEATHVPPLLTARGERVELRYDVYCGDGELDGDVDTPCRADGVAFVRVGDTGPFREVALREDRGRAEGRFVAVVPDEIARSVSGFSYHAQFRSTETGLTTSVPAGGTDAPQRSVPLGRSIDVELGAHAFGRVREPDARAVEAAWGTGPAEVGLEQGRNLTPIGGSAFDVEADGTAVVLDEANKRLLRWRDGRPPEAVPVAVTGTLADMTLDDKGNAYVLETTASEGSNPLLRIFDRQGVAKGASTVAGRPSQVRVGPTGPVVLQSSTAQWMPAVVSGRPVELSEQVSVARPGRPLPDGREVVILRTGNEVRVALVGNRGVQRSWVVHSETALAEVQLAEPRGTGVVLVTRVFTDDHGEYVVLVLDRSGVTQRFSLRSAEWAEAAPLSRFRLRDNSLYQLGSTPAGLFVDRFDLEVK